MRILLVHNLAPWDARAGGGQRVSHELALGAAAAGHDVRELYLGDPAGASGTPVQVVWVRQGRRRGLRLAANATAVARAVRRLADDWRPDVVHASAAEGGLLPRALPDGIGLVATSHHPDPAVVPTVGAHPPPGELRRLLAPLLEAALLRGAHRVVAVSHWGADVLRARGYLPPDRPVAVVHNGVGDDWFTSDRFVRADPTGPPTFLFVGRMEPAKGWDVLLAALARPDAPGGARVDFAGSGPDELALLERIRALGLDERVRALGRVEPTALRARLSEATALVLPSRHENHPLVLLEAMAAGVPVIAAAVGGVGETLADGASGLLVPPDDPRALAAALARVAGDPALRRHLVAGGRAVAERHRWSAVARRMEEEYHLAAELARPVPRPAVSPVSALYRRASARAAAARAPRARSAPPPANARRIAVVRPGRLGDLLLTEPLLAALAERWPGAAIELVTDAGDRPPPWIVAGPVAHRTLALRRGADAWRRPSDPERAASLRALAEDWVTAPPDLLLVAMDVADPVARSLGAELAALVPLAWRAALSSGDGPQPELHATVPLGPPDRHEILRMLGLAAAAGADGRFRLPRVPPADTSALPPWSGPTVAMHPGASRANRQWPLARWGELAARAAARGARTVVVGDAADRAQLDALAIAFDERAFVDRVGRLDLPALAGALGAADAFVGNDSFPFHLAVAAGTPAWVLVGPGAARWTSYPDGRATVVREPVICSPRRGEECPVYTTCPHGACMQSIRVETVADAALRAIG